MVGATRFLDSEICRRLKASHLPVKGIIRPTSSPDTIANLTSLGVEELVSGDLRDKESLERACQGVNTVFIYTATMTRSKLPGDSIEATSMETREKRWFYFPLTPRYLLQVGHSFSA